MCKGQLADDSVLEPQWRLDNCGKVWRFSLPATEMPELDLNEHTLRLQMKVQGCASGSPLLVDIPAYAAPVAVDAAKCKYSSRRQELVVEWTRRVDREADRHDASSSVHVEAVHSQQATAPASVRSASAESEKSGPTVDLLASQGPVALNVPSASPAPEGLLAAKIDAHVSPSVVPVCLEATHKTAEIAAASVMAEDPVMQELPPTEPEPSAEEWKARGKAAIKEGDLDAALSHYSAGLAAPDAVGEAEALLCSSRALCLQSLGRHEEALADAERCVRIRPDFVVGLPPRRQVAESQGLW